MWGRVIEVMTAVWLALSPFIFRAADDPVLVWVDSLSALAIACLAGLSYWAPMRRAHLLILAVAVGLAAWGRLSGSPPPPEHQNHITVGIFLLMIAIIPNDASQPPRNWREAMEEYRPDQRLQ